MIALAANDLKWRLLKLGLVLAFGLVILISNFCSNQTASVVTVAQLQPSAGVQLGLIPQPTANQPLPTPAGLGMGLPTNSILQNAARNAPCDLSWAILAGVARVEDSSFGATHAIGPSIQIANGDVVHAYGPAQMLLPTWATYGDHVDPPQRIVDHVEQAPAPDAHVWIPDYAYAGMARLLCANHVDQDPVAALYAYSGCVPGPRCNRTDRYPFDVLALAAQYATLDVSPASPIATNLINEAETWLGVRYLFGGTTRAGIDCSAYVQLVYRSVGVQLDRTSQAQYNQTIGRGLGVATPAVGDLAFFRQTYIDPDQYITHVGVVAAVDFNTGAVTMIHAPGARAAGDPPDMPDGRVREEVITGFLASHLAGYARVLPSSPLLPNQA